MEDEATESTRRIVEKYDTLNCVHVENEGKERKLVLSKAVSPSEVILHIPSETLLNAKTIAQYLPQDLLPSADRPSHVSNWRKTKIEDSEARLPLTSVQSLTLLLAAWKSLRFGVIAPPISDLDEVLSTLPKSYPTFPLVWKVTLEQDPDGRDDGLSNYYRSLLEAMPANVSHLCEQVHQRFVNDCAAIRSIEKNASSLYTFCKIKIGHLKLSDLLWAWCSVNSRCVYLPLGLKLSKENFTLAPLLDMANHTMMPHLECKVKWTPAGGLQLSAPAKTYGPQGLAKGQEVMIAYGAHSNGTLLSEYGFTLCRASGDSLLTTSWTGNPFAEVNVDDVIERLLARDLQYGLRRKTLLREAGYYGDYTIHPHPQPAHISFRLVIVLRLLVIADINQGEKVQAWRRTISGEEDEISIENESATRLLLTEICDQIVQDRRRRQEKLGAIATSTKSSNSSGSWTSSEDVAHNHSMIDRLLREEEHIATLMKAAVESGHPLY